MKSKRTQYIFPRTNFLIGMGSIINIAGNYFEFKLPDDPWEGVTKSIASAWETTGQNIKEAMKEYEESIKKIE